MTEQEREHVVKGPTPREQADVVNRMMTLWAERATKDVAVIGAAFRQFCAAITKTWIKPTELATAHPDTKTLTLCTLPDRKGGEVTVGGSRLRVVPILATIQAHGVAEAALSWPQLTEDDLDVLAQLVADFAQHEADSEDDAAGDSR